MNFKFDTHPPLAPQVLLQRAGLSPKKSWGQNFLCDATVLRDIALTTTCGPQRPVVELGAGLGALTYYLVQAGGAVVAVERDRQLVPALQQYLSFADQLTILEANAATLDYGALAAQFNAGAPLLVAGNLPYQLSGRILVALSQAHPHVARAVLLVQREVAERLVAGPGEAAYGLLSVLVQRIFAAHMVRVVPPGAFFPAPKVYSAVVCLTAHPQVRDAATNSLIDRCARAAFAARRKTLRNALRIGLNAAAPTLLEAAIEQAQLHPGARAETLSLDDFARLGAALAERGLLAAKAAPERA